MTPLPWQRSQWEHLLQRQAAGRLPHALLCSGPAGLGKRVFAESLAQALLCTQPAPDGAPCGHCKACHLFAVGSHPDYLRVEPEAAGKAIKVDQIRDLTAFLGYTSQAGGYKIALLVPAERMNLNAANSLLKILEEPPGDCLLLLVTAAPAQLPATVRSRCQPLALRLPPPETALAWLAPRVTNGVEPAVLLELGGGAPLRALAYAGEGLLARRQALFASFAAVVAGQADPVRAAELWMKEDWSEPLRWLIDWYMDMIRLKMTQAPPRLASPDLRAALRSLAQRGSLPELFRRLDAAIQLRALSTTSLNRQLLLEAFLGDCAGSR